jgi:hypothetical protein
MNRSIVAACTVLVAGAAPAIAQDPGAAGGTTAAQPATGSGVQIDVTPLIQGLIKKATRRKPASAVPAAEQVPEKPPEPATVGAVAAPADPQPSPAEPTPTAAITLPGPAVPVKPIVVPVKPSRPQAAAATATPRPSRPMHAADPQPTVAANLPNPAATTPPAAAATPQPATDPAVEPPVAPVAETPVQPAEPPPLPEPVAPSPPWLMYGTLALLALVLAAAAAIVLRRRRLVARTRSLLKLEPRLDLGRGRCTATGLAFSGGSTADG